MLQHGQVADVITFEFKPRAALVAHFVQDMGNVAGGVLEHQIVRVFEEGLFPRMLPVGNPPVVMLMMPSHPALIAGRNPAQCAGSEDGWPVSGWRACRCRIAAPASAAPIALAVICAAVTGR